MIKIIRKKREKIDMDNNNNNNAGNNFFSGFLLGAIVGAAVVFLLATKKGKKLLKIISEEGINNISNILDETVEGSSSAKASHVAEALRDKSEGQGRKYTPREFAIKERSVEKPKVRRFFRGISRRLN